MKQLIQISCIAGALLVNLGYSSPADPKFAKFKSEWSSSIAKTVTVTGTLTGGKLGYFLNSGTWGFYVYASSDESLPKLNTLSRLLDKRVLVTGVLRFHKEYIPTGPKPMTGIPEHFYFDIAEVEVSAAPTNTGEKKSNQSVDPTTPAVTASAEQERRHQ